MFGLAIGLGRSRDVRARAAVFDVRPRVLHERTLRELNVPRDLLPAGLDPSSSVTFLRVQVEDARELAAWYRSSGTVEPRELGDLLFVAWLPETARELAEDYAPCAGCGRIVRPTDDASSHDPGCPLPTMERAALPVFAGYR